MELKQLELEPRVRNAWQVFDLTLQAVRRWGAKMMLLWLIQAMIVYLPIAYFFDSFWALMVVWWLKPIIERPLLHYASQAAFSNRPGFLECLATIKNLGILNIISILTIRRFSLQRAYMASVDQLEGLSGARRKQRIAILEGLTNHRQALWLVYCVHLEILLLIAISILAFAMIPESPDLAFSIDAFFEFSQVLENIESVITLLAYALVAPLYVTGGFLGYIHSRIELEGWDIEISFRRIASRFSVIAVLSFAFFLSGTTIDPAMATESQVIDTQSIKSEIDLLYQSNDIVNTAESFKLNSINADSNHLGWLEVILKALSKVFEYFTSMDFSIISWIFWVCIISVLIFAFWKISRHSTFSLRKSKPSTEVELPQFISKIKIQELPDDLLNAARDANAKNDPRLALTWLLHFALRLAQQKFYVTLHESMTERECQNAIEASLDAEHAAHYKKLFSLWLAQAWAHRAASSNDIDQLIGQFSTFQSHIVGNS